MKYTYVRNNLIQSYDFFLNFHFQYILLKEENFIFYAVLMTF